MKFIADGMLGKLARWLRMMGQDVTYNTKFNDNELLRLSKVESRVLLTKDFELYKRAISRGLESFYVEGKRESERLAEIAKRYGLTLEIDMDKSHCPICNTPLKAAPKEELKDKIEPNTYTYYDKFWRCPNCSQIYWQGAHWKQISNTIIQAQQTTSSDSKKPS
ncbi:MAG TPA: Mut7-C RNAse domain-containing protein [Candidatus Acidoferrales bacterium]|nr:Mut7-C RNAse domain-containing protein [Candidatus Acidoferrales bacterium]